MSASVPIDEIIVQIRRSDVMTGRGKKYENHVGNVDYRRMVKSRCQEYQARPEFRHEIALEIVKTIEGIGGRFIRPISLRDDQEVWVRCEPSVVRSKVKQALRDTAKLFEEASTDDAGPAKSVRKYAQSLKVLRDNINPTKDSVMSPRTFGSAKDEMLLFRDAYAVTRSTGEIGIQPTSRSQHARMHHQLPEPPTLNGSHLKGMGRFGCEASIGHCATRFNYGEAQLVGQRSFRTIVEPSQQAPPAHFPPVARLVPNAVESNLIGQWPANSVGDTNFLLTQPSHATPSTDILQGEMDSSSWPTTTQANLQIPVGRATEPVRPNMLAAYVAPGTSCLPNTMASSSPPAAVPGLTIEELTRRYIDQELKPATWIKTGLTPAELTEVMTEFAWQQNG